MNLTIENLDDLPRAASLLAPIVRNRGVVALYGDMGAGKTTLIAALVRALGSTDPVASPTFALVNDYATPDGSHIHHFDFYRIDSLAEAFDLGYEEYFYGGELCLVEWPEKIEPLLPPDTMRLKITVLHDGRRSIEIQ